MKIAMSSEKCCNTNKRTKRKKIAYFFYLFYLFLIFLGKCVRVWRGWGEGSCWEQEAQWPANLGQWEDHEPEPSHPYQHTVVTVLQGWVILIFPLFFYVIVFSIIKFYCLYFCSPPEAMNHIYVIKPYVTHPFFVPSCSELVPVEDLPWGHRWNLLQCDPSGAMGEGEPQNLGSDWHVWRGEF